MDEHDHTSHRESRADPELRELLCRAYATSVDVDTAARHLWVLHRTGTRIRRRRLRQSVLAACISVLMISTSGIAVAASGNALPGDPLYQLKRGTERVHLFITRAPESDARLHLKFARMRLSEAVAVAPARPAALPGLIGDAATSVERAQQVGGEGIALEVNAVREEASETLSRLSVSLDPELLIAIEGAAKGLLPATVALDTSDQDAIDELPRAERSPTAGVERRASAGSPPPPEPPAETAERPTARASSPEPADLPPPPSAPDRSSSAPSASSPQPSGQDEPARASDDTSEDEGKRMPEVRELGDMLSERPAPSESHAAPAEDGESEAAPAESGADDSSGGEEPKGSSHSSRVSRLPVAPGDASDRDKQEASG